MNGWNSSSSIVGQYFELDWMIRNNVIQIATHSGITNNKLYNLSYVDTPIMWYSTKSYQIITTIYGTYSSGATSASFSVSPWWNDKLTYTQGLTPSSNYTGLTHTFYHYSTPTSNRNENVYCKYQANGTFSYKGRGIISADTHMMDFDINGYAYYKLPNQEIATDIQNGMGWYYNNNSYYWYDRVDLSTDGGLYPVGGKINNKTSNFGYRLNNFIYKHIPHTFYNLSFYYENSSTLPIKIYTSKTLNFNAPSINELISGTLSIPSSAILVGSLTGSVGATVSFYGLRGNQYIYFVAPYLGMIASTASCTASISNIVIDGGYNIGNNDLYILNNGYNAIGLTGATYSSVVGNGNTITGDTLSLDYIKSKIGNGTFKSGVWENGVWNNGWREDTDVKDFYDIRLAFAYNNTNKWRVEITGPTSSISNFNISDKISIGNIISIDINENRKTIKNYFTIINKTNDSIIVEFDCDFPIRRIEKDSIYHRINITRNVWLSGAFFNGYFSGVWNFGLFKGYPMNTEMYNTHWIDGLFDGGHFKSDKYNDLRFKTLYIQNDQNGNFISKLGLTFSTIHNLTVGDTIVIDKDEKTINNEYDGECLIDYVLDPYQVVTNINFGQVSVNEVGTASINLTKGLIQSAEFNSNNISNTTSLQSSNTDAVFMYNSWMDVNYNTQSAVNIGKLNTISDYAINISYSENNLYGYPTFDILETKSSFRDSYSNTIRKYKLGYKYKLYQNFIGDSGIFRNYFDTTTDGTKSFIEQGWTYSNIDTGSVTFSRTVGDEYVDIEDFKGEELKVVATGKGGVLNLITPIIDVNNRSETDIEKMRYSMVMFDLLATENITNYPDDSYYSPKIHFNNLNVKKPTVYRSADKVFSYLPINQNIEHTTTPNKRKIEYFYNKTNLLMNFRGGESDSSTYIIDNLFLYEVDMIPFFQYFTDVNINKSIQIPYFGISPLIDYSNINYNFINSISIGLDSIKIISNNNMISGYAAGINTISIDPMFDFSIVPKFII